MIKISEEVKAAKHTECSNKIGASAFTACLSITRITRDFMYFKKGNCINQVKKASSYVLEWMRFPDSKQANKQADNK